MAQQQIGNFNQLAMIANNIANNATPGYRTDKMIFSQFIHRDVPDRYSFPNDMVTLSDLTPGPLVPTNRPLDVAVHGEGFFLVRTPSGVRYTKNGSFRLNADNMLVDNRGNAVLSADSQEIVFEEGDGAPMILEDGRVLINGDERGIIGVVDFPFATKFYKHEDQTFSTNKAAQVIENPRVAQGMVEESNSKTILELNNLITIQRLNSISSNYIHDEYSRNKAQYRVYARVGGAS